MRDSAIASGALLIAALGASFASCAKAPPDSEEPQARKHGLTSPGEVRLYWGPTPPTCPFVRLGQVRVWNTGEAGGESDLQVAIAAEGGDAAIRVVMLRRRSGLDEYEYGLQGIAIRFTFPGCNH